MMHNINTFSSSEISVIVQGAVGKFTGDCLKSIRQVLPQAEIILSTWKNSCLDGLDYDILIENNDPGSFPCDFIENSIPNNINRQLVSTQTGLASATRKYAIKMRTDFYLKSDEFMGFFERYRSVEKNYAIFKSRVLCCNIYTRNPRYKHQALVMSLCPSDFFYFGYTEDLRKMFDIPLVEDIEQQRYFEYHSEFVSELNYKNALCQYMPEQYIWISCLRKYFEEIYCQHRDQINKENRKLTEHSFVNNFVILSRGQLGIESFKEDLFLKGIPENCFTYLDWKLLYYGFCKHFIPAYWVYRIKISSNNLWRVSKRIIARNGIIKDIVKKMYPTVSNLKDVKKKIQKNNCEIVSFDIFDTILFRRIAPDWVPMSQSGLYGAFLLKKYNRLCSPELFNKLRDKYVEKNNTSNLAHGLDAEYTLENVVKCIVEYFNIPESDRQEIIEKITENEVERELSVLCINPEVPELFEYLKKIGKKIVLTSDMYLSQNSIEKILANFSITNYIDYICMSSSFSYTKKSGKLYKKLLEELKVSPNKIMHIGDNFYSDIKMARKEGIYSVWYHNIKNEQRKKFLSKCIENNLDISNLIKSILPVYNNDFYGYIRKYLGLDICNFVHKLMIDSLLLNVDCLFFLERDGNIYKDLFEKLSLNILLFKNVISPDLKLLKLSRKDTACLLDLNNFPLLIDHINKVNPPSHFSILHFIGCFGITEHDISPDLYHEILKHNESEKYLLNIYASCIKPLLIKRQQEVIEYLNKKGFYEYSKIGLVDIGWGGTSQKDIQAHIIDRKLNMECYGFYYACDERIKELPGNYYFYHHAENLLFGYSFLEFAIKQYTSEKEEIEKLSRINPQLSETLHKNYISRQAILDSAEEYSVLVNQYALTINNIATYTKPTIIGFIQHPPKEFINMIKNIYFSLDRKVGDDYILLVDKIKNSQALNEQYCNAQWVQGSKVLSNFYDFSRLKKYYLFKKIGNRFPFLPRLIKKLYFYRKFK